MTWTPGFRPKTGFQLWLEENRNSITAAQPGLEETDVIKEAMGRFRTLSAEERLVRHTFRRLKPVLPVRRLCLQLNVRARTLCSSEGLNQELFKPIY